MAKTEEPVEKSAQGGGCQAAGAQAGVPPEVQAALRALPRVDDLLASAPVAALAGGVAHAAALDAVRACLDGERARVRAGGAAHSAAELGELCAERLVRDMLPHLRCAVNATGVVVHTNLGRAPLAASVAAHVADVAAHYSNLEFDLEAGARGSRHDHVRDLICRLTGAQDACVVNNNAAAVMLVLAEFARGRQAVVSRGELVEIGGSFRVPDIMALSGAQMVEVGTTNKTHLADYERAVGPDTALVLKVHPSNYRVVGFHEEVDVRDLARLAHERGAMVYEDQGSGVLVDLAAAGFDAGEHTPGWSLAQGVDLVSFSGDKLLGAGQAGIVVGSAELVARLRKNPLMRALRPDKMTLAALDATLRFYLDPAVAWREVPVLRMLGADPDELRARAERLLARVAVALGAGGVGGAAGADGAGDADRADGATGSGGLRAASGAELRVCPTMSMPGGGSLPTTQMPGYALRLDAGDAQGAYGSQGAPGAGFSPDALRARLLARRPRPIVARVHDGALLFDVRTLVDERDENDLVAAVAELMGGLPAPAPTADERGVR